MGIRTTQGIRAATAVAVGAVIALAACGDDFTNVPGQRSSMILYGRVQSETGAGIVGARIDLSYHPAACSVAARSTSSTTTGADGRYRTVFEAAANPLEVGCVRLRASANGFRPDSAQRTDREFRRDAPFDSAQTNFTLRP